MFVDLLTCIQVMSKSPKGEDSSVTLTNAEHAQEGSSERYGHRILAINKPSTHYNNYLALTPRDFSSTYGTFYPFEVKSIKAT